MKPVMAAALLGCGLAASPANAEMSVGTFLGKADALKAKGILALASPDLKLLKAEMEGVGKAYRTDILAARAAGRTPHSCPPKKPQKMSSDEFLSQFRTYPATISVKSAFYGMMKKRYPCPTG